jgi:hypothetical protein
MRAKHGWHVRSAAFAAALRITPPHHTQTTCGRPSPLCLSVSPVLVAMCYSLKSDAEAEPDVVLPVRLALRDVTDTGPTPSL